MFFIFGIGRRTVKPEGKSAMYNCPRCHNTNRFELVTVRTWFTLFFIPVLPYQTEHIEFCPICQSSRKISKTEMEKLKQDAGDDLNYILQPNHPVSGNVPPVDPAAPVPPPQA